MFDTIKDGLWKQFGASIDMLANAIRMWPEEQWTEQKKFFYMAYHSVVFLDYYLTLSPKEFVPILPFTPANEGEIPSEAIDDVIPNRIYSKEELLNYLQHCKDKCRQLISGLTIEGSAERWIEDIDSPDGMNYSILEILLYNMRHVQHHAAQLNQMLRHQLDNAPRWVARAKENI